MNIIYIASSLDGFIARPDGDIDWLLNIPNEQMSDYGYEDFIKRIDCLVMGRKTFDSVLLFDSWPYSKPVFVLSSTLTDLPEELNGKAEIINGNPEEVVDILGSRGYHDLYIDGGQTIQSFLKEDLIDEMIITTVPIILGEGISLCGNIKKLLRFKCEKVELLSPYIIKHYCILEKKDW